MTETPSAHVLDNPTWPALDTYLAHFGRGTALAKLYLPDVAPFSALADHSEAALQDLRQLIPPSQTTVIGEINMPPELPGWTTVSQFELDQLVCQQSIPSPENTHTITELSAADLPAILHLIELTHPGPFLARTVEMGRYIGIYQDEQLVAMAGERGHFPGYCEISAVCTHPDWQGRGYSRLLMGVLTSAIWARGEIPFLHVFATNTPAYRLYQSLHFTKRAVLTAILITHD